MNRKDFFKVIGLGALTGLMNKKDVPGIIEEENYTYIMPDLLVITDSDIKRLGFTREAVLYHDHRNMTENQIKFEVVLYEDAARNPDRYRRL